MWVILFLILALILFGGGFVYNALWIAAFVALVLVLVSFFAGRRAV